MSGVYVIAEAGASHDGSEGWAHELVRIAKQCGADAVKFQACSDPQALVARRRLPAAYAEQYRRYLAPLGWLPGLRGTAHGLGLGFMCTAFLPEDVCEVAPLVDHQKVASLESADEGVLLSCRDARANDQRVLVSLGLGADYNPAMRIIGDPHLVLLHCVASYPAPASELNLARIRAQQLDGYSDHSHPALGDVGALAVAAGARWLEVHFALDATPPDNPDHPHSRTPEQLSDYITRVRRAEVLLGDGADAAMPCEATLAQLVGGDGRA
jgi:sialic acid synthase SpsE